MDIDEAGVVGEVDSVEHFSENGWSTVISGWVAPQSSDSVQVVELYLAGLFIRSQRADLAREDLGLTHAGRSYGFRFFVGKSLLVHLPVGAEISVVLRSSGKSLPICSGVPASVEGEATDDGRELRLKLEGSWQIDHWGNLHRSFGKVPELKDKCLDFYVFWMHFFREVEGRELFLVGGNLLGIMREFDFLDHDDDIDASFCIRANTPAEVADSFFEVFDRVAPLVTNLGYRVKLMTPGHFQIVRGDGIVLDILMSWLTKGQEYFRLTGKGGYFGESEFLCRERIFRGRQILVPEHAERELEIVYGPDWRQPDPHFVPRNPPRASEFIKQVREVGWRRFRERQKKFS